MIRSLTKTIQRTRLIRATDLHVNRKAKTDDGFTESKPLCPRGHVRFSSTILSHKANLLSDRYVYPACRCRQASLIQIPSSMRGPVHQAAKVGPSQLSEMLQ